MIQSGNLKSKIYLKFFTNKNSNTIFGSSITCGILTHIRKYPFQLLQLHEFSGRKGGLKRKKANKLEVKVQRSLGRRMEFYHPTKKKRKRIRLVQNSRGNLVYDSIINRFLVVYYKQGMQVFRPFSTRNNRFELARTKSITLARQLSEKYYKFDTHSHVSVGTTKDTENDVGRIKNSNIINMDERLRPDVSSSGVRGVIFDSDDKSWVVHFNEAGTRKYRKFNIDSLGFQNAYTSAIAFKRFKLLQYHQFLPMRQRYRRGRKYLR